MINQSKMFEEMDDSQVDVQIDSGNVDPFAGLSKIYSERSNRIERNVSDCITIISCVASAPDGKTQKEISNETGIPYSSVARYVRKEKYEMMTSERIVSFKKKKETPGIHSIYYKLLKNSTALKTDEGTCIYKVNMSKYPLLQDVGTWMGYKMKYDEQNKKLYVSYIGVDWRMAQQEKNVGIVSEDWGLLGFFDPINGSITYNCLSYSRRIMERSQ